MAEVTANLSEKGMTRRRAIGGLLGFALLLTLARYIGILPEWLHRLPEEFVPPLATWLDAIFNFIKDDLHLLDDPMDGDCSCGWYRRLLFGGMAVGCTWRWHIHLDSADRPMENRYGNHVSARRRRTTGVFDRATSGDMELEKQKS